MSDDIFRHGGAIDLASEHYNIAVDHWLDLSTGINPTPYPITDAPAKTWHRLPLKRDTDAVLAAAKQYYGIVSMDHIACGPGTQALIQLVPFILAKTANINSVAIFGPTYGEHAPAWQRAHIRTTEIYATPDMRQAIVRNSPTGALSPGASLAPHIEPKYSPSDFGWSGLTPDHDLADVINTHDAFVIVNPNNPDGGLIDQNSLFSFATYLQKRGKYLIIDEAFADTAPDVSLCPKIHELTNTIILRSFGKFFGLAGIRVGFAVAHPAMIADITDRLGPWAVSGPALHITTHALGDQTWHQTMRDRLAAQAKWLDQAVLHATDCELVGGTSLLRLYRGCRLPDLQKHLARQGIWVRGFTNAPNWLRFGLPGISTNQRRLISVLSDFPARTGTTKV
jgi:cobalamin biosynthetic protein CobC